MKKECLENIHIQLRKLGIQVTLDSITKIGLWLRTYKFAEPIPVLTYIDEKNPFDSVELVEQGISFVDISKAFSGNFGTLYSATRESPKTTKSIFFKAAKQKEKNSIHIEGLLQALSYSVLSTYGFPWAVPRVLDIARHPHLDVVFTIEKCPDAKLFHEYLQSNILWGEKKSHNDYILLTIISQLATYLAILEHELLLNHRDLTGSNVLMITPTDLISKTVSIGNVEWTLLISHKTILIDFGFAAIGSMPSRKTVVSAGDFFSGSDLCPKEGRDLFLFLASLWKNPLVRQSVTHQTECLFKIWLTQSSTGKQWGDWMEGFNVDIRSLYLLTIHESFSNKNTNPLSILHDISREYPFLVSFPVAKRPPTPIPS
jgi:serine/threonine protein kinase